MMMRARMCAAAVAVALGSAACASAGPITPPPGPVSGTHKTLTEVEPRTAINLANTPGDNDASPSVFKITQPGSYYLTGNVTGVSGKHGIEVAVSGVTIDLNGFRLSGVAGSLDGINTSVDSLTVCNGTVTGWGDRGIRSGGSGASVRDVHVDSCGGNGISVFTNSVVVRCVARQNGGTGIQVGTASVVEACAASGNGDDGISSNSRSVVSRCAAEGNTGDGISGVFGAAIIDSSSGSNAGVGIRIENGGLVSGCVVSTNGQHGISSTVDAVIVGNACDGNGTAITTGAGIIVSGADNRIEGNTCTDGDVGFRVSAGGNLIVRNTCSGNGTNWDVASGNVCLVVSAATATAVLGNAGGTAPGSTDPNVNFTY